MQPEVSALKRMIEHALDQGIKQVEAAGSPLHPFLFDETGKMLLLYDNVGGVDPMELALQAIKQNVPNIQRCALVIDSRITLDGGKKWDAVIVMACERDAAEGEVWAHRYLPKGLFRKFRTEGEPEQVGKAKNFIKVALEDA